MTQAAASAPLLARERVRVRVRGQVQGVGFRPFVYRLATELGLSGWVRNDAAGVEIEIEGEDERLAQFHIRLAREAPVLARIDAIERQQTIVRGGAHAFRIDASRSGSASTAITPDAAVCTDCLAELFDPRDRRYRYPFINCTHCGPRYTITRALPYDRGNTSMAPFTMCAPCATEYHDPRDRRFHAQPDACPACGPRLQLVENASPYGNGGQGGIPPISDTSPPGKSRLPRLFQRGEERDVLFQREKGGAVFQWGEARDVVVEIVERLQRGGILALKGLGGFHLVCDARNAEAVARLRARKQRDAKPFAVMVANIASLRELVRIDTDEAAVLASTERPIVLLQKRAGCDAQLPGVAPDMSTLGVMLPYTPLQYLLFHEAAGRPDGADWLVQPQPLVLVCTSANPHGEPLVIGNDEAFARLHGIADAFVLHDRDILIRCDDSVVLRKGGEGGFQFIRRARGYTPQAIKLARSGPSVLACGGYLKNTICLTRGDEAFVSQHIGDLDNAAACRAFEETVAHLIEVLEVTPAAVTHDLHPDFFSTRFALRFAETHGVPCVPVQHHHAHIAAIVAEHGITTPVLGVALDGVGYGSDGGIWGGELLHVQGAGCDRIGHLQPLALPGGDRAALEPWRMAASALHALGRHDEIERRFDGRGRMLRQLLDRGAQSPLTSSAGRLFDAAAGLLGVASLNDFEGQAAMRLEALATRHGDVAPCIDGWRVHEDGRLDVLPLLERLANENDPDHGAALFHATLTAALAEWIIAAARERHLDSVAFGGGCFLNRILSRVLRRQLEEAGLTVFEARRVPPNDGGLSLGESWVAMQSIAERN